MIIRKYRLRTLCICFIAVLFLFVVITDVSTPSEKNISNADSLSLRIKELRYEAQYAEAVTIAHNLLDVLKQDSTAKQWQIADSERLIATLKFIAGLSESTQQELSEADRLTSNKNEHFEKGEYADGVKIVEQQLKIREKILGPEHPEVALTLNDLAVFLNKTSDYTGALSLYERSLVIYEKALGKDHPDVARTLNNLAGTLEMIGKSEQAKSMYERALRIREKTLGPDHPDVGLTLSDLAVLLRNAGDYAGARSLYERALGRRLSDPITPTWPEH